MKVKELFTVGGMIQSFGGTGENLDWHNCQIQNKTKNEDSIVLQLKRESDGEEGRAYLRVQEEFLDLSLGLLNWAFNSKNIISLTLNQLNDFETNLEVERTNGKLQLK